MSQPQATVAEDDVVVAKAIHNGLANVQQAAAKYSKRRNCFSCHHQTLPMLAMVTARSHGLQVDDALLKSQAEFSVSSFRGHEADMRLGKGIGGRAMTVGYALWALALADWKSDETTVAMVAYLLKSQRPQGHWTGQVSRAPLEESYVTCTVLAAIGMKRYASPAQRVSVEASIARARAWLATAALRGQEDKVARLWGVHALGGKADELRAVQAVVLENQRDDGGWAQLDEMESDAYATGQTLFLLQATGLDPSNAAYRRGIQFLLKAQRADGAWLVVSRSKPIQPYFPYDDEDPVKRNQFISVSATSWAVAALATCRTTGADEPASRLGTLATHLTGSPLNQKKDDSIDFDRARELFQKRKRGEILSAAETKYLQRAIESRRGGASSAPVVAREQTGLKPLTEMTAKDRYKGQDGGLYGNGRNAPPDNHRKAAAAEVGKIQPLAPDGNPDTGGRIVLISISMSNATQEFSTFKRLADVHSAKSPTLTIVDCAQGGQAMAEWVNPQAPPWREADRRIAAAQVTARQVQVAWIKLANKGPRGELDEHGKKLQRDTLAVIQNARARFPKLRIAYLSSRIYGGYATNPLNPEPFAYESAFVVRWLIQDQIKGDAALNFDAAYGPVKAPLLLWGPYLWADGTKPRQIDKLVWNRADLAGDGTHPSSAGQQKVARMLLDFFRTDETAKPWFVR